MSLKVTSILFANQLNSLTYAWLKANRGQKIPIEINCEVSTSIKIWSGNTLTYAPDSFVTLDFIQSKNNAFKEFYVGDTIKITDVDVPANNGNYTISEKPNDKTLRLDGTFTNALSANAIIEVVDVVDKMKMNWNFIENSESANYLSKVDGNKIEASQLDLSASVTSPVSLDFKGEKSWQIGDLNIEGVAIETSLVYKSKFKITGNLYLNPFFLANEWPDISATPPIQPAYFKDFNSLKFAYRLEGSYVGRSPQYCQIFEDALTLGQSGGYGESFDLNDSNYKIDSFTLEDSAPSIPLVTSETDFTIVVKNTTDAPFTSASKFDLNFIIAPETEAEYQNNGFTLDYNFRFDTLLQTVGAGAVDGDEFGESNRQVWKNVSAVLDSSSQITITGQIALDTDLVAYMKTLDNPRYIVWVGNGKSDATGSNLVTNGAFATNLASWTIGGSGGWTWVSGAARAIDVAGALANGLSQTESGTLVAGKNYILSFDVLNYISGTLIAQWGTHILNVTANGSYSVSGLSLSTTTTIVFYGNSGAHFYGDLDNVSLKRVIGADEDDRASDLVDVNDFYQPLADDDTLLEIIEEGFIPHTSNTKTGFADPIDIKVEDEVVAYKRIKIDLAGSEYNVSLKSIRTGIRLKNSITEAFNDMDEISQDFSGSPVVNGLEFINISTARPFKMPNTELAKNFVFARDVDADSGTERFYDLYFPFLVRWEYWEKFIGLNSAFFDISKPNDGLNNEWPSKDEIANWAFYHFMELTFLINGREHTITTEEIFEVDDYDSNADWDNKTIKAYDADNNELTNGVTKFILGTAKTKIVVSAEFVGVGTLNASDIRMMFRLEPFENGGRFVSTRISSVRDSGEESQWYFVDSKKITETSPGSNVFVGTAYIDNAKLQNFNTFAITARIYQGLTGEDANSGFLLWEDGDYITQEDGFKILID